MSALCLSLHLIMLLYVHLRRYLPSRDRSRPCTLGAHSSRQHCRRECYQRRSRRACVMIGGLAFIMSMQPCENPVPFSSLSPAFPQTACLLPFPNVQSSVASPSRPIPMTSHSHEFPLSNPSYTLLWSFRDHLLLPSPIFHAAPTRSSSIPKSTTSRPNLSEFQIQKMNPQDK